MYGRKTHLPAILMLMNSTFKPKSRGCGSCKRTYMTKFEVISRKHRPIRSGRTKVGSGKLETLFSWWPIRNSGGFR
jgi:hypothetical protein